MHNHKLDRFCRKFDNQKKAMNLCERLHDKIKIRMFNRLHFHNKK